MKIIFLSKKHLLENLEGGQAYVIHNEVRTINHRLEKLQKLIPEARIGIAHGQMAEKELNWSCVISTKRSLYLIIFYYH